MKIYSQDVEIKFYIEKYVMLIMKKGEGKNKEGIDLPNQESIETLGRKEIPSTWKYLKWTLSNKQR